MPRGEWRTTSDLVLTSPLTGAEYRYKSGSDFVLLDTNGSTVMLAQKGYDRVLTFTIEEFHDLFEPHWKDSHFETYN